MSDKPSAKLQLENWTASIAWPRHTETLSFGQTIGHDQWLETITPQERSSYLQTINTQHHSTDLELAKANNSLPTGSSITKDNLSLHTSLPQIVLFSQEGSATNDPHIPEGEFELLQLLGEGGMGQVHEVFQHSLKRQVAIKRLKRQEKTGLARQLLLEEARITGFLEHPNIIPIHALGLDENEQPVLVMKRVEGRSWQEIFEDTKEKDKAHPNGWSSQNLETHIQILIDVCNAIHFAHSHDIVHRDIKLENVMVGEFGEVCLLDWGLASRLPPEAEAVDPYSEKASGLMGGHVVGTPAYLAPEMLLGSLEHVDARTDVYLLGATLYHILCKRPLHWGETLQEITFSALSQNKRHFPKHTPAPLVDICQKAVATNPNERYQSAQALRQALEDYLRNRSSLTLSEQAWSTLSELEKLLEESQKPIPDENTQQISSLQDEVTRLFAESKFGFTMALREWSANPTAQEGLEKCLTQMIQRSLEQRDAQYAAQLLRECPCPQPELEKDLALLQESLRTEQKEQEALRKLAQDMDFTFANSTLKRFHLIMSCFALAVSTFIMIHELRGGAPPSHLQSLYLILFYGSITNGIIVYHRKKLLANTISRRFGMYIFASTVLIFLYRFNHYWQQSPIHTAMTGELVLVGSIAVCGAIFVQVWVAFAAAAFLLGAILCVFQPQWVSPVTGFCMSSIWITGYFYHVIHDRKEAKQTS